MSENETIKTITYEYLKEHKACGLKQYFEKCRNSYFQYIMSYTNQLDSKYSFTHRLYWVINCITQFPKCVLCGNDNKRIIRHLNEGYSGTMQYCCHKCCTRSEHCIETRKQTTFDHLGVYIPAQSKLVMDKIKKTTNEHFGSDCYFTSDIGIKVIGDIIEDKFGTRHISKSDYFKNLMSETWNNRSTEEKQDIIQKSKKTKKERYGDENYTNRKLAEETNTKLYGFPHAIQNKDIMERSKKTNLEKRGVEYASQDPKVIQKSRETRQEKYNSWHPFDRTQKCIETNRKEFGVDWFSQTQDFLDLVTKTNNLKYGVDWITSKESPLREKIEQADRDAHGGVRYTQTKDFLDHMISYNREHYGKDWFMQTNEFKEKSNIVMIKEYGTDNIFKSEKFKEKNRIRKLNKTYDRLLLNTSIQPLFTREEFLQNPFRKDFKWKCLNCGDVFVSERSGTLRCEDSLYARCYKCYPSNGHSVSETKLYNIVKELFPDTILGDKNILEGKELDIYIPSKNIAIEYDGLYWHSNHMLNYDYKYHFNKMINCKNKGIQLIHVFDDEFAFKEKLVISRIKSILGIFDHTVYARKCLIKQVSKEISKEFLNENHIQGNCNSKYQYGLYYNNELISLMTFGSYRKALGRNNVENEYEMLRFCNKQGYHIPGSASKLFTHFIKEHDPNKVISYADRRWSEGNLYKKLNFQLIRETDPNYWYIIGYKREHRFAWRKSELKNKLEIFDENKTEYENMLLNGYDCIFDCGNLLFEWAK